MLIAYNQIRELEDAEFQSHLAFGHMSKKLR